MAQIKKDTSLRKSILQTAITGQLISNVEGESLPLAPASKLSSATPSAGASPATPPETGKELLDRIIEERMSKEKLPHGLNFANAKSRKKKTKKETALDGSNPCGNIPEEEIPFEIPENWCWCRLEDLVTILGDGLHGTPQYDISGEYYFVNGNNLNNGLIEIKPDTKKVNKKEFEKYKKELNDTTIFISINGTIGNIAFYNDEKIILGKSACYFNVAIKELKNYFFYLFQSDYFLTYALDNATGTTIKNVGLGTMRNFLLPLPPLAVQNAIVEKLEQVLPLVDAYENALLQKEELKSALPDKVKKAILQEAITGQLTEAWRKSATIKESGKQLLDRIIEERNAKALSEWEEALKKNVGGKATLPSFASKTRAKKPVPVVASEIDEEEIPFEVPESWCWCRLGDLGDFVRGSGIKRDETRSEGFPCIRYGEMYTRYKTVINETVSFVDKNVFNKCQKIIKNDIAMALTGENEYDIALAAVYTGDKEVAMGGDMTRFRPAFVNSLFLVFALNSPYGIECKSELATGNIIVHISNDKLGSIMIPLPPLDEQEEIVKKVEELLPLCK